ncbi:hypothetical protein [Lamprobacter modestohalophilus]|uniref:hypothetical protein n=1 Tax=Lamprobacter modestohalophilus TaxID=1064514 RepID=UPI001F5BC1F2|nr:hypothetical protein [Lamprobacter modestohalophilus]
MTRARLIALTAFAMIPLSANSWLCRAALRDTEIDPASFTSLRLISGALMLWLLLWRTERLRIAGAGGWPSAIALFRRLPEKRVPNCAGCSFAFEERRREHSRAM